MNILLNIHKIAAKNTQNKIWFPRPLAAGTKPMGFPKGRSEALLPLVVSGGIPR